MGERASRNVTPEGDLLETSDVSVPLDRGDGERGTKPGLEPELVQIQKSVTKA